MAKPRCSISVKIYDDGFIEVKTIGKATAEELLEAVVVFNRQMIQALEKLGALETFRIIDSLNIDGQNVT